MADGIPNIQIKIHHDHPEKKPRSSGCSDTLFSNPNPQ